jgi:hypothetical protein
MLDPRFLDLDGDGKTAIATPAEEANPFAIVE